jgi:hypothetical protein
MTGGGVRLAAGLAMLDVGGGLVRIIVIMENMESAFPWALLLIPLVLLAIVAGLFFMARYYRRRAHLGLEQLRSNWRRLESAALQAQHNAQAILDEPEEPYLSLARQLRGVLDGLTNTLSQLREQRVALNERAHHLSANPIRAALGTPFAWLTLDRDVHRLQNQVQRAVEELQKTQAIHAEHGDVAWKTAEAVRAAQALHQQVRAVLQALQQQNMQGAALKDALSQAQHAQDGLQRLPDYFTKGERPQVLEQAEREQVIQAHQWRVKNLPALQALLTQANTWQENARLAQERVGALRKVLDDIDLTLSTLPAAVDSAEASRRLDGMQQIYNNLHATLGRLEVDSAHLVAQEADKMIQAGQEMSSELKRARRDLSALEGVLNELPKTSQDLALRIATLGAKSIHPLQMPASLEELTALKQAIKELGSVGRKRSPEAISNTLRGAIEVLNRQKELTGWLAQLENTHAQMQTLLSHPPLKEWRAWIGQAGRSVRSADEFSAENWSRADNVGQLRDEIDELKTAAGALALDKPEAPLDEQALPEWMAGLTQLSAAAQAMDQRLAGVRRRLEEIQSAERHAIEELETAAGQLGQLEAIIRSSELLRSLAGQELERLQREVKAALEAFADRRQGAVERKERAARQLTGRLETSVNTWLNHLDEACQATVKEISSELYALEQIAPLDEGAMEQARRLVEQAPAHRLGGRSHRSRLSLSEAIDQLRQTGQFAESLGAALNALADFSPLLDTYGEADAKRQAARRALAEAISTYRGRRTWPPSSVSFDAETREQTQYDAEWQRLKQTPARALALSQALGNLGARYQALTERVAAAEERAAFEADAVNNLLVQIDDQANRWVGVQTNLTQTSPNAAQEINNMLIQANHTHDSIQRQYKAGNLDYKGVMSEFKSLLNNIKFFQAEIDSQTAVDITGSMIRRRDSTRRRLD